MRLTLEGTGNEYWKGEDDKNAGKMTGKMPGKMKMGAGMMIEDRVGRLYLFDKSIPMMVSMMTTAGQFEDKHHS